ncbi:MAG: iron chelate uptake ABC transporter family permease subunit [Leptolyngbyaceae cyanobacterium RM2_2_4]|nr:iron chelate uptake ABC transporter family permease subunit [Leptolyngbyaceae cyanobacterium RM2_2_4]
MIILVVMILSVGYGEYPIAPLNVIRTLLGLETNNPDYAFVIYTLRLPRVIVAFLVGMALAIAGTILQGLTRNPLAAPEIIGVDAGAGLAAVALIVLLLSIPVYVLPIAAFAGASIAALLVYTLAWKNGSSPIRLILVGVGVGSTAGAFTSLMITFGSIYDVSRALVWLTGSVYGRSWKHIQPLLPWLIVFIPLSLVCARELNTINLGDEVAQGLGSRVEWQRGLLLISVALAGASVATAGTIGFVGLMSPHLSRQLVDTSHEGLILTAALVGGLLVTLTDFLGRSTPADCTPVDPVAGTTCVPNPFERLITLDGVAFEDAIALGIKPIATVFSNLSPHLNSQLDKVENIGQTGEPSLENVLALNPDLIMGLDSYQPIYAQTSKIAPTVLFEFEHSGQWKEVFQTISQMLGREDTAQQVMDDYNKRLEEFKAKMGDRRPIVSVVRIYPNSINLYLRDSFPGTVLQDAGLARPSAQDVSAADAQRIANNPIQISISRELLSQSDGDVLFVWTAENEAEANQKAQKNLEELQHDPLWKTLDVVQKNKVYFVPSYWIGAGPIAANAVIDDLFKYLIETPQS